MVQNNRDNMCFVLRPVKSLSALELHCQCSHQNGVIFPCVFVTFKIMLSEYVLSNSNLRWWLINSVWYWCNMLVMHWGNVDSFLCACTCAYTYAYMYARAWVSLQKYQIVFDFCRDLFVPRINLTWTEVHLVSFYSTWGTWVLNKVLYYHFLCSLTGTYHGPGVQKGDICHKFRVL